MTTMQGRRATLGLAAALLAMTPIGTPAGAQVPAPENKSHTVGGTVKNMGEKPLKDLNLMKPKVPPLLLSIQAQPYALDGLKRCPSFAAAIGELDEVLGPDVDSTAARRKGDKTAEFALGATQDLAGSLIPGSGLIRRITGADKEARAAAFAYYAGGVRRAYLKGTARARGCRV